MIGGIAGGPKHGVQTMSLGEAPVPSASCFTGFVFPRTAVLTTPSVKSAYMIRGTPGPFGGFSSRFQEPVDGAVIAIAFGVLPVGDTCWMVIGAFRNAWPVASDAMLNTVNVLADEFVAISTFAACPPPVWFVRPPGLGVLMRATGRLVRVLMITICPDWNDWM